MVASSIGARCDGTRPSSETRDRRMIARARNPCERSRWRAQVTATARPRSTNATVVRFCMNARTSVIEVGSGCPQPMDRGHLAYEQFHDLGIPLVSGAVYQQCEGLVDREPRPVRAVVDERVESVADGDDSRQARDLPAAEAVRIAAPVEPLVVVADDWQQARRGTQRPHDVLANENVRAHALGLHGVQGPGLEEDGVGDADL